LGRTEKEKIMGEKREILYLLRKKSILLLSGSQAMPARLLIKTE
jgi:hypothetical protein